MTHDSPAHLNGKPFDPSIPFRELVKRSPADPARRIMAISILVEGLSQKDLAEVFGVTGPSLSRAAHSATAEGKGLRARLENRYGLAGCIFSSAMVNSLPSSLQGGSENVNERIEGRR